MARATAASTDHHDLIQTGAELVLVLIVFVMVAGRVLVRVVRRD
jgi:hypothetical protein